MSKISNQLSLVRHDLEEVKFLMDQLDRVDDIELLILNKLVISTNTLLLDLNKYQELNIESK